MIQTSDRRRRRRRRRRVDARLAVEPLREGGGEGVVPACVGSRRPVGRVQALVSDARRRPVVSLEGAGFFGAGVEAETRRWDRLIR